MQNPQASELLEEVVEKLKNHADSLPDDPREASNAVADAWKRSKKIRKGRALTQLDENLISKPSNSNEGLKSPIPIQVQVWSQTQGKMDNPASEIRCGMCSPAIGEPTLSESLIHSGSKAINASAGFNFPYFNGERRPRPEKINISSQAILYSRPSGRGWVLRDKSTRLGEVVEDTRPLRIVNTKSKTLAVAIAVRYPHESSEHFIFDISDPWKLVSALQTLVGETHILRNIELAGSGLARTRFLTIPPELDLPASSQKGAALPPATLSNRHPNVDPYMVHSSATSSRGLPPESIPTLDPRRVAPPAPSQLQSPSPQAGPHRIAEAQLSGEHRLESSRSSSPAISHYSDAQESVEPSDSQVDDASWSHQPVAIPSDGPLENPMPLVSAPSSSSIVVVETPVTESPINRQPARLRPSINPMALASAPSASSIVVVEPPVTQNAIISTPVNQPPAKETTPPKHSGGFIRRVKKAFGW
ncbi:hypothetical protein FRC00_005679 [Tulasnella sp. 408]|nr:hypothetical protein FRC00_005679 [Tulasnella sp. 408]